MSKYKLFEGRLVNVNIYLL